MEISVIICNREKDQDLIPCVEAVLNQKYDNTFEVILIDDCSKNESLPSLQNMPVTVIEKENHTGWFGSLKLAVETAKYDILAFADSHCIVGKEWLKKIHDVFDDKNIMSGYANHGKSFKQKFSQLFTHSEFSSLEKKNIQNIFDGNFVVRKDYLKEIFSCLPIDEKVSDGAGAIILANAVIKSGNHISHEPEIKVFHLSENFRQSMKQWFYGFGPNTITIRRLDPGSKGAKYLKLGLLAPFVLAIGRWVSLSRKFAISWKKFNMRIFELPIYFLWYNACIFAYLLGMVRYMSKEKLSFKNTIKRVMRKLDIRRQYKEICYFLGIAYRPLRINIEITDICNLRCPTCSKWKELSKEKELTKEEWAEVFNKVKGFALSRVLSISGGEPFCRKDIFDILGYAEEANLEPIIISNGTLLDRKKIETLKNYSVKQITLSINGINSETHDPTRGINGSLKKIMASLDLLLENNIPVVIETIVLKTNLDEIIDLVNLAQKKKLKGIIFQVLTASNVHNLFLDDCNRIPEEMWYRKDPLWIDDTEKLSDIVNELVNMKKNGSPILNSFKQLKYFPIYYKNQREVAKLHCMSGISTFMIDPYGNVRQCYSFEPIDNILKKSPKEIWHSSKAKENRKRIKDCQATCRFLNNVW